MKKKFIIFLSVTFFICCAAPAVFAQGNFTGYRNYITYRKPYLTVKPSIYFYVRSSASRGQSTPSVEGFAPIQQLSVNSIPASQYPKRPPPMGIGWTATAIEGAGCSTFTQPKVGDIDGDGRNEVVSALMSLSPCSSLTTPAPRLYVWDEHGQPKTNFPFTLTALFPNSPDEAAVSIVGIGDVFGRNDGTKQIVFATKKGVYVLDHNANLTVVDPQQPYSSHDDNHVVLGDLDDDGILEVIVANYEPPEPSKFSQLHVWDYNGSQFVPRPGWPYVLGPDSSIFSEPAFVDLGSGGKMVIANVWPLVDGSAPPKVVALRPNGTVKWTVSNGTWPFPPLVGDLNFDGTPEIVFKGNTSSSPVETYYVLDLNGKQIAQWPSPEGWSYGQLHALGDINNDGVMEVVYHDDTRIYASDPFTGKLLPGFPIDINAGLAPASYVNLASLGVADIDADGRPDIFGIAMNNFRTGLIGSHQLALFAYNGNGQALSGYPVGLTNTNNLSGNSWTEKFAPTYTDLEGDGYGDLVIGTGWGTLKMVTLGKPYDPLLACHPEHGTNAHMNKVVQCITFGGDNSDEPEEPLDESGEVLDGDFE